MGGSLEGRVALVTGAGRGLGRAYALALAAAGSAVAVNNRSAGAGEETVAAIVAAGGTAVACPGDLEDPDVARRVVADAVEALGRLDVVVNNAGGADVPQVPFVECDPADRDTMMRQNFNTAWDITAAAWPHLVASGAGRIVLCGSPISLYGSPGFAPYAAAKAALVGLARTLAVEGKDHGIGTNVLLPVANTRPEEEDSAFYRWFAVNLRVEHIAALVTWLADPRCEVSGDVVTAAGPRAALVTLAQTRGYVDSGDAFTAEAIAANWDAVDDRRAPVEFDSMGAVMAHWHEVFGPVEEAG